MMWCAVTRQHQSGALIDPEAHDLVAVLVRDEQDVLGWTESKEAGCPAATRLPQVDYRMRARASRERITELETLVLRLQAEIREGRYPPGSALPPARYGETRTMGRVG